MSARDEKVQYYYLRIIYVAIAAQSAIMKKMISYLTVTGHKNIENIKVLMEIPTLQAF